MAKGTNAPARKASQKILVVEDNPDNRDLLVFRLERLGFEILVAGNGREALEVAGKDRPDLIFMDLKMPVMDGWQATKALKQTDWGKNLPIIAVTAHALESDRARAMAAGCDDFVPKPITDYSILERKIRKFLKAE